MTTVTLDLGKIEVDLSAQGEIEGVWDFDDIKDLTLSEYILRQFGSLALLEMSAPAKQKYKLKHEDVYAG